MRVVDPPRVFASNGDAQPMTMLTASGEGMESDAIELLDQIEKTRAASLRRCQTVGVGYKMCRVVSGRPIR